MEAQKVKDILDSECPNKRSVFMFDSGEREEGAPTLPSYHFYTFREIGEKLLAMETVIAIPFLEVITEKQVRTAGRSLRRSFERREKELNESRSSSSEF